MLPRLPGLDAINDLLVNAVSGRQDSGSLSARPDLLRGSFRELGSTVQYASAARLWPGVGAVLFSARQLLRVQSSVVGVTAWLESHAASVSIILTRGCPFQVIGTVVRLDAVDVVDTMHRCRPGPDEGSRHEDVNADLCTTGPRPSGQIEAVVALRDGGGDSYTSRPCISHTARATDVVETFIAGDGAPHFGRGIIKAHSDSPPSVVPPAVRSGAGALLRQFYNMAAFRAVLEQGAG